MWSIDNYSIDYLSDICCMKKLFTIVSLFALPLIGLSQEWIFLGNDPADDLVDTDYTDLLSASYYIEEDSIYFLLTSNPDYFLFEPGFGIAIGIDTNLVADDGLTNWGGLNQSMKPDHQKIIVTNSIFPNDIAPQIKFNSENKDSLILRFYLEAIDTDEQFNVIFGTGIFNLTVGGMLYDEAPNEKYYSIDITSSNVDVFTQPKEYFVYPNPTSDFINIKTGSLIRDIHLLDFWGRRIHIEILDDGIDVSSLRAGQYFIRVKTDNTINTLKFIKL